MISFFSMGRRGSSCILASSSTRFAGRGAPGAAASFSAPAGFSFSPFILASPLQRLFPETGFFSAALTASAPLALASEHRRFDSVEENPRDQKPNPDNEPKKTDQVNRGQAADPLFPQLLEVGNQTDGKERHGEEELAEHVQFRGSPLGRLEQILLAQAEDEQNRESQNVTQHELG